MILDNTKILKFGPGSHEEILLKCDECGDIFNRQIRVYCQRNNHKEVKGIIPSTRRRDPLTLNELKEYEKTPDLCLPCSTGKRAKENGAEWSKRGTGTTRNKIAFDEWVKRAEAVNVTPLFTEEEWETLATGSGGFKVKCDTCGHEYNLNRASKKNDGTFVNCVKCFRKSEVERKRSHLTERRYYFSVVNAYTRKNWSKYFYFINPDGIKRSVDAPLDHKVSKRYGFENNIPPYIIGSAVNLYMGLSKSENSQKHVSNSITPEELHEAYRAFYERNGAEEPDFKTAATIKKFD